jgi:hypothetical protein
MRPFFIRVMLVLLSIAAIVGVPLFLMMIALSNALDASPQPMLIVSYAFAGGLILMVLLLIPRLLRLRRRTQKGLVYSDTYLDAAELRSEVTLAIGTLINLGYAVFKLFAAARYRTLLFAAEAFYYLVLSLIRMQLAFGAYSGRRRGGAERAWKRYRNCGWELLVLDLTMTFVIVQSLRQSIDYVNLSALVYGSAFWAFFRLSTAIAQIIKYRGSDRPLLSASKLINLSAALMSIYILQNTLLLHFGNDELFRQRMNTGFGVAVSLAVIVIAIDMIVHATQKIRDIRESSALEQSLLNEFEQKNA